MMMLATSRRATCVLRTHSRALSALPSSLAKLETVKVDLSDKIATVTINRPKALNALSATVVSELTAAMGALGALVPDDAIRCVIVTGAGEKAFVAGADIAGMQGMGVEESARDSRQACRAAR